MEVPELAIVPAELFEAAQSRIKARSDIAPTYLRKPKRPLSGLLRCGACGGGMSTYGKKKGEQKRVRCTRAAETGTCPDPHFRADAGRIAQRDADAFAHVAQ